MFASVLFCAFLHDIKLLMLLFHAFALLHIHRRWLRGVSLWSVYIIEVKLLLPFLFYWRIWLGS